MGIYPNKGMLTKTLTFNVMHETFKAVGKWNREREEHRERGEKYTPHYALLAWYFYCKNGVIINYIAVGGKRPAIQNTFVLKNTEAYSVLTMSHDVDSIFPKKKNKIALKIG